MNEIETKVWMMNGVCTDQAWWPEWENGRIELFSQLMIMLINEETGQEQLYSLCYSEF